MYNLLIAMPTYCDVALPVPLDMTFTYKIADREPVVGGRVLVPFRAERLSGVVIALHDRAPSMQAKAVLQVLDSELTARWEFAISIAARVGQKYPMQALSRGN
ncbi:MAG TPA: hypothetical protein VJW20_02850 [Candidatus Angelobacter sp.]|nr:hypothetical protein [Candidatus Angelobacter sp.]